MQEDANTAADSTPQREPVERDYDIPEGGWPRPWHQPFLDALDRGCTVADACRELGLDRGTPYGSRSKHPEFAEAWAKAADRRDQRMGDTLAERLTDGWLEDVYHEGIVVGQKRVFDNRTALGYLRSRRPQEYAPKETLEADRHRVEIVFRPQPDTPPNTKDAK